MNFRKTILDIFLSSLLIFTFCNGSWAQYVHPNQAGRKGGDTQPGTGKQIVTSTYYGNVGNAAAQGVIMSVNKDGTNPTSFHGFAGYPSDGSYPWYTTPFQASDGNLYGASFVGGTYNWGAVYKYNLGNGQESVIYNSTPSSGGSPANYANINELSDGKIYTLQTYGGNNAQGGLYKMNKDGSNVELVHNFRSITLVDYTTAAGAQLKPGYGKYDGAYPYGFVVEGPDGKVYGSCYGGGSYGIGVFYRCNKDGSNYEVINVCDPFYRTYSNGRGGQIPKAWNMSRPWGNVAIDQSGKVYVVGYYGGALNLGGVARMSSDGSNYQILHSGNVSEGSYPYRGPIIIDNRIYGTYSKEGPYSLAGGKSIGTVYGMNLDGTNFKVLKGFDNANAPYADGTDPWASLSYDGEYLYGTTLLNGGPGIIGTIFKVRPNGSGFKSIHRFSSTAGATCNGSSLAGLYTYYPSIERVTFANVSLMWAKTCIPNQTCNAGSASPILSTTTIKNQCPNTVADLTNIIASNKPTGAIIEWHSALPISSNNLVAKLDSVVAGTYYAVFYDPTNGCYASNGSSTTTVTVTNATCPFVAYAPPVVATKLTNICPATTANLSSLIYGSIPNGTVITWHTGSPASSANKVANPASVSAGTYYASYYHSVSNTFSPTSSAVTISTVSCTGTIVTAPCPGFTASLDNVITTSAPLNTVLTWHTGSPATAANQVSNSASAGPGTYYPAYYDATNTCYGTTGAPVTIQTGNCSAGTIDCSKTRLSPAPTAGTSSIVDLIVTVNVTTAGIFGPITVSGSGMTLLNSVNSVTATTTGIQQFHILLKYDGSSLGTLNFSIGSAGSCSADLTLAPKSAISTIWTLDCVPMEGPSLK